jgi:hypothetical protein
MIPIIQSPAFEVFETLFLLRQRLPANEIAGLDGARRGFPNGSDRIGGGVGKYPD